MKAYQIMMFLMLFNIAISIVAVIPVKNPDNTTRGLFEPGVSSPATYNVSVYRADNSRSGVVARILTVSLISLVTGAIAGAVIAYLSRVPADAAIAYSLFATTFWGMAYSALSIFWDMGKIPGTEGDVNIGIMVFVFTFTAILAVIFAVGLIQLIRGGFKSMV